MCLIMTTLFNRIFNSLYAYLPWNQNSHKRLRDDSSDENEENFNIGVTPPKKQKLQRAPFGQKILKEMNPPTVTTVKTTFKTPAMAKLQITEDIFQTRRKIASKPSVPHKWGTVYLGDSGKPPKHVSSPIKLRRRLPTSTPIANIDLTRNDELKAPQEQQIKTFIDLTTNSSGSGLHRRGHSHSPVRRSSFVDLTSCGSGSDEMAPKKANGKTKMLEVYRRKSSEQLMKRKEKPILSIDLTAQNGEKQVGRKKRGSVASSSSNLSPNCVTVIDLEERNTYGRVLGSMLEGKLPTSPQMKSPPITPGLLVDLTRDDEEVKESDKSLMSVRSDSSVKYVTASPVIEIKDDTFKTSLLPKNGLKSPKIEVPKVNSFDAKLKDVPFTHQEWVMNLMKEYHETQKSFSETRDRFFKEATAWSDENRRAVEELLEKKLERHLKITEALITETPDDELAPIIVTMEPFSKAIEAKIKAALARSPESEVLIDKFNLKISRRDIHTLSGLNWLNDEVINFYMQLLEERSRTIEKYPSLHTFSTFFYAGLQSRGHAGMKRWTKKVNIFEKQLVIIPIHLHMHWCLVVIDMRKKELNYYDSMGHDNNDCLKHMSNYLMAEHIVKQGSPLDMTDWKVQNIKNIPQQMNGSDCGIFACTYAEFSSRRAPFNFDQSKMQYFRRKAVYEIITGQLMFS